jgi:two-component system alkaline phosphatase synthesis response regulator PhoP
MAYKERNELNMVKILVVDDNVEFLNGTHSVLEHYNYTVTSYAEGLPAFKGMVDNVPDLILLDVSLPDVNGVELCRKIKNEEMFKHIPIIMISANQACDDKVSGLNAGADDYIGKPFMIDELIARIEAVLRRFNYASASEDIMRIGDITADFAKRTCKIGDVDLELTAKESELLRLFISRHGQALSKETILDTVWGLSEDVSYKSIDMHVSRLRKKIGEPHSKYIKNVWGVGYMFSTDINED